MKMIELIKRVNLKQKKFNIEGDVQGILNLAIEKKL